MGEDRRIAEVLRGTPTMEGAGVRLKRVFGFNEVPRLDPFLLLDEFGSDDPADYLAGFPWHPHRGIETVTYMLAGEVEHGDSLGNQGVISSGDVQWMTAGSGIIHQEMPRAFSGHSRGFQLWLNLPAAEKMTAPRYRDVRASSIPVIAPGDGIEIKVVAGEIGGERGPVADVVASPEYLDVALAPGRQFARDTHPGHTVLAYVVEGSGWFGGEGSRLLVEGELARMTNGASLLVRASDAGLTFLLISGMPLGEPVAWAGPIVMNTQEELETAFREYQGGTFIKPRG